MKVHRKTAQRKSASKKAASKEIASKETTSKKTVAKRAASKDALQFTPNFTAYVLPPDVVCLYSEDRKFFLHGELYCTLVSAIAKGSKSAKDLLRDLRVIFASFAF